MSDARTPAQTALHHGAEFPFDAPDAWWNGEGVGNEAPPPEDWAHAAARGVLADLNDRAGIDLDPQRFDEDVRAEIVRALAAIIREAAP